MESFATETAGQHTHPGEGMCTNCWNLEAAPGFEFCGKCVTEAINRQKQTRAEENDPKKEREKINRNKKLIEQINQALENANLSEDEYQFVLSLIPKEIQQDGTEMLETLRGYKMSSNVKNKSRKVEQMVAGLLHLLYGYKTPAVLITAKAWYAPKMLKLKLEERSEEIQSRHKNNVNFLASSLSMMEQLLGSCPDVKRTENNAESVIANKINQQFMKLNKKVANSKEDEADEDEEDIADDSMGDEDEEEYIADAVGKEDEDDHVVNAVRDEDEGDHVDDDYLPSTHGSTHSNGVLKPVSMSSSTLKPVPSQQVLNGSRVSLAVRAYKSFNNRVQSLGGRAPRKAWADENVSDDEGGFLSVPRAGTVPRTRGAAPSVSELRHGRAQSSTPSHSHDSADISSQLQTHTSTDLSHPSHKLAFMDDSASDRGSQYLAEEGSLPDLHRSEEMDDGILMRRRDPSYDESESPVVSEDENEIETVDGQTTNSAEEKMRINKKNVDATQKLIAEASIDVITIPKEQSSTGKGIVIYQESLKPDAKGPSQTATQTRVLPIRGTKGSQAIMFGRTPSQIEKRNRVTNQLAGNTKKMSVGLDQVAWLQEGFEENSPTCGVGGNENFQEDQEPDLSSVQSRSKISTNTEFLKKLDVVIEEVVASSSEPVKKHARVHYPKNVNKKLKVLHPKNSQFSATVTEIENSSTIQKQELETRKTFQGTPKKDDRQVSKHSGAESGKPLVPISSPISVTTLPAPPSSSPPIPAGGTKRKNYQIGGFQAEKKVKTMLSKKKTETVSCSESVVPHQKGGVQQNKKSTRGRTRRVSNTETPSKAVIKETMGPALKFVGEVENRDEISDL